MKSLILIGLLLSVPACAHPSPTLSPPAQRAFTSTQIIKSIDLIRDTAQEANAQTPPLVSTDGARAVTEWHRSALVLINAANTGWKDAVAASLTEVFAHLSAADQHRLAPYFELTKTVFAEFVQ